METSTYIKENFKTVYHYINSAIKDKPSYGAYSELKSEIIAELLEKDVMAEYDPSKSKINTYLTRQIHYACGHVLGRIRYTHKSSTTITTETFKETGTRTILNSDGKYITTPFTYTRTEKNETYVSFSTDDNKQLEDEISSDPESSAYYKEILASLTKDEKTILSLQLKGKTTAEMATSLKCSISQINVLISRIKRKVSEALCNNNI